jgi:hypothetical protein
MATEKRKPSTQKTLFDVFESEEGRAAGIRYACSPEDSKILLKEAQDVAKKLASSMKGGALTADDVSKWYEVHKRMDLASELGNSMGALFAGWEWTGEVVNASKIRSHARILRVWRWTRGDSE